MLQDVSILIERSDTDVQTVFTGKLPDQAALLGFINALYNLGYAVVSVEQIGLEEAADSGDED